MERNNDNLESERDDVPNQNNNYNKTPNGDDFDYSDEAAEAALLELITHIAYMCARYDYLDFYQRWLNSLQATTESGPEK